MRIILVVFIGFLTFNTYAQMDKRDRRLLNNVDRYYKKQKFKKASSTMELILNRYPVNISLWNLYQDIAFSAYYKSVNMSKSDENKSSLFFFYNAIYFANMSVPYNSDASSMLRNLYVDKNYFDYDLIADSSKFFYEKGNESMNAHNYQDAIEYHTKSFIMDTVNYQPLLRLGEVYTELEYYGKAINFFKQAMDLQPKLNEPVKLLAFSLNKKGDQKLALETCKKSLLIYPEESIFSLMESIIENQNKSFYRNWILRLSPINIVGNYYKREEIYTDMMHFKFYREALLSAEEFYDINGLLKKEVTLPMSQYLEVYCWEKMLEATENQDIPSLSYARYIQGKGLLEPYVLINLFNVDLYAQFNHFVENKQSLAEDFINTYLISDGFR